MRARHVRIALVLISALALISSACSSSRVTTNPTATASPSASQDEKAKGKAKKNKKKKGKNAAEGAIGETAPSDPGAAAAAAKGDGTVAGGLQSLGPGGPEFARKSAHVEEPKPDAEKGGPLHEGYAEAVALDVQGLGEDVRITFTMNGRVPERFVTPNTIMVVAFGMSGEKDDDGGYAFGAQGKEDGWTAYAGAKNETKRFPGTFFIKGNKIEFTLPWSFVAGPRPFEFYASSSWFRGTGEQNTTSYSFDVIPNGKGRYPN